MENILPDYYPQQYEKVGYFNDLSSIDFILNVPSSSKSILVYENTCCNWNTIRL